MIVATFSCEKMFHLYKSSSKPAISNKPEAVVKRCTINRSVFKTIRDEKRKLTGGAVLSLKAYMIALHVIENQYTIMAYQSCLSHYRYPYKYMRDGNDRRVINVAAVGNIKASFIRTHQYGISTSKQPIFSRDCQEVGYTLNAAPLTRCESYFKSMLDKNDPENVQQKTITKRKPQNERIAQRTKDKFWSMPERENIIVPGDPNDYLSNSDSYLLFVQPWLENVAQTRLSQKDRWACCWSDKELVSQRYYILLSRRLVQNAPVTPYSIRTGLGARCMGGRISVCRGMGKGAPAASDHFSATMR